MLLQIHAILEKFKVSYILVSTKLSKKLVSISHLILSASPIIHSLTLLFPLSLCNWYSTDFSISLSLTSLVHKLLIPTPKVWQKSCEGWPSMLLPQRELSSGEPNLPWKAQPPRAICLHLRPSKRADRTHTGSNIPLAFEYWFEISGYYKVCYSRDKQETWVHPPWPWTLNPATLWLLSVTFPPIATLKHSARICFVLWKAKFANCSKYILWANNPKRKKEHWFNFLQFFDITIVQKLVYLAYQVYQKVIYFQ